DESLSTGHALGFDFPLPNGGTTNTIDICSNGYIWWVSGSSSKIDPSPSGTEFDSEPARLCPFWSDISFDGIADDVYFNTFTDRAVITWNRAKKANTSAPTPRLFTVQCQIFRSGRIQISYSGGIPTSGLCIVGWTQGGGTNGSYWQDFTNPWDTATDPTVLEVFSGSIFPYDIDGHILSGGPNGNGGYAGEMIEGGCATAIASSYGQGCGSSGLQILSLSSEYEPVIGQDIALKLEFVFSTSTAGALLLGYAQQSVDLTPIGATACTLLSNSITSLPVTLTGFDSYADLTVPYIPAAIGQVWYAQGVTMTPGVNPLGVLTSNGLALTIGEF
ncbi:MAG: hypothetical protein GY926_20840, partial [bacterium]|nr:hypothetical protein [bacterium]